MLVPGATIQIRPDKGRPYRQAAPWRIVLHTMECAPDRSLASLREDARTHAHPPQLWASLPMLAAGDVASGLVQCIDTDLAGEALEHPANTVETNHAHAIQIEIAGFAKDAHTYPVGWWEALGVHVLGPLAAHHGVVFQTPTFFGEGAGFVLASRSGKQRMTSQEWLGFNGICGHQHVPENSHWDPGLAPIAPILAGARASGGEPDVVRTQTGPSPAQLISSRIL
jgi:hypothetical protein